MKLAIKGHSTRGKEVIELLKMLGGANPFSSNGYVTGNKVNSCYYISEDTATKYISWDYIGPEEIDKYKIFTLEEFLEKYPFKVGDKVVCTKFGDNYPITIKSMEWTGRTIEYIFDDCVNCLAKDLKMWNSNDMGIKIEKNTNMNIEFDLTKYSYEFKDGKLVISEKKPKYPTTYKDCCKVLMGKTNFQDFELVLTKLSTNRYEENSISPDPPYINLINNFYKLLICRDAYWKIAGEEMGLDKPWKPDWTNLEQEKHCIWVDVGSITLQNGYRCQHILVFPTAEMRDAFYENFKDLIEQCKELL